MGKHLFGSFLVCLALSPGISSAQWLNSQQSQYQPSQGGGVAGMGQILAQGAGGVLTVDAVSAYIEALEFSLAQVGQPTRFDQRARMQIAQSLAQAFPGAPLEMQRDLAQARVAWSQYSQTWNMLSFEDQREFVYEVLSIAYGEVVAANAVGQGAGTAGAGGGASAGGGYDGGGYDVTPDYGGSGCWAAAGCSGYDESSDSYTTETYDSSTGSYEEY